MREWIRGWRMTRDGEGGRGRRRRKGGETGRSCGGCERYGALPSSLLGPSPSFSVLSASAAAQSLAKRLDARLDRPPFNRQLWGVALVDETGRLLYGRNAGPSLHSRQQHQAGRQRRRLGASAAGLDGEDQCVRRTGRGRRPPRRPRALRPGRPDHGSPLLRHRLHAARRLRHRSVRPPAPAGRLAPEHRGAADRR